MAPVDLRKADRWSFPGAMHDILERHRAMIETMPEDALFLRCTTLRSIVTKALRLSVRRRVLLAVAFALALVVVLVVRYRTAAPPSESTAGGGFVGGDFHSLVADPMVAGRVFVGGHQAVSLSSDGGASWVEVPSLANADAMGWSFSGGDIWVSGHPGIVKTSDDTKTVQQRSGGLSDTDIHALGGSAEVLYAAGPGVGFVKSTDDATTWTNASESVGQSFFGRILVDPNDVNHVVAADPGRGVFASFDGGVTWKQLTSTPSSWVSSPDGLVTLYASGGGEGAARSADGGSTWSPVRLPESATTVEADPTTPNHLYAGAHDGDRVRVWSSDDDGKTWNVPQSGK